MSTCYLLKEPRTVLPDVVIKTLDVMRHGRVYQLDPTSVLIGTVRLQAIRAKLIYNTSISYIQRINPESKFAALVLIWLTF